MAMRQTDNGGIRPTFHGVGAAFFPEHHSPSTWPEYANLMAGCGLTLARMAEFSWDKMEPREGEYDFSWLDEAMGMLDHYGIRVVLCTPTAVPPIWACECYPDVFPVMDNGATLGFGTRRYTCPTSPSYRRLTGKIAAAMADHYAGNPQVIGWQLDNEIGWPFCFCPRCLQLFQRWCETRFGNIECFNDLLVTHFSGQSLQSFGQVPFPTTFTNPGLWVLYHRFASDMTIDCFDTQIKALKAHGVTAPVTTNMMLTWYGYDHEEMGEHLDVIAGDHYSLGTGTIFGKDFANEAFCHAYLRSFKHGRNPWFHEFQCGRTSNLPVPGQVRWNVLTQIGLGADLINFFRFDTCPSGGERDAYGMIGVHRKPGRIYHEVRQVNEDIAKVRDLLDGTQPAPAKVAVLYTFDNHCHFVHTPFCPEDMKGQHGNGYSMHLAQHFGAITRRNIPCQIVNPGDDFGKYDVIVAPALYLLPEALAKKLRRFVADGGKLVMSSFSGLANEHGAIFDNSPAPGPLAEVCGVEVRDYGAYSPAAGPLCIVPSSETLSFDPLTEVHWLDEVMPVSEKTEVLAHYDNPFYNGSAAVTRHAYGNGCAYYLGAVLTQEGYDRFYCALTPQLGLKPLLELPDGLYATARTDGETEVLFINNPGNAAREVELEAYTDLLTGQPLPKRVTIKPFDVMVLAKAAVVCR